MLNYIKIFRKNPSGSINLDSFKEVPELEQTYAEVTVTHFFKLNSDIVKAIGLQYLKGARIVIDTPAKKFHKEYHHPSKVEWIYKSIPLDLSQIPQSLAEFENGAFVKGLRKKIYNLKLLDKYNKSQIARVQKHNTDYTTLEQFYKLLLKDCAEHNICCMSPNEKTWPEYLAEKKFEQVCREHQQAKPLSVEEKALLEKYGPAYGIEVRPFIYRVASRKTKNGYTQEPEEVLRPTNSNDFALLFGSGKKNKVGPQWETTALDKNNEQYTTVAKPMPSEVKQGYITKECHSNLNERKAYNALMWFMKYMPEDGLMPEWHKCPICGEIYHEVDGCSCGYCKPVVQVRADNLFYGIESTFEDYDSTESAYDELEESTE